MTKEVATFSFFLFIEQEGGKKSSSKLQKKYLAFDGWVFLPSPTVLFWCLVSLVLPAPSISVSVPRLGGPVTPQQAECLP